MLLESPLNWQNYMEKFQLLLHLEEQQMEVDIKRYNIPNNDNEAATMCRDTVNKKLLVLKVCSNPLECFILEVHQLQGPQIVSSCTPIAFGNWKK